MNSIKKISLEAIKKLPETVSFKEIVYELHLINQVMEAEKDIQLEKTISTEKLLNKIARWKQK